MTYHSMPMRSFIPTMFVIAWATLLLSVSLLSMVNFSQGKPYIVTQLVSKEYSFAADEAKFRSKCALTDGLFGSSTNWNDGQYEQARMVNIIQLNYLNNKRSYI